MSKSQESINNYEKISRTVYFIPYDFL
ncbi:MAG: hypothetical protein ACTS8H_01860 [Arsenophonus sp. NC-PE1-MAG3]